MPTRSQLIAEVRTYVGTPFLHRGRTPGVGLDCAGVALVGGKRTGLLPPDLELPPYSTYPPPQIVWRLLNEIGMLVTGGLKDAKVGDLVLTRDHGRAVHMGILVPGPEGHFNFVHSTMLLGAVKEHILDEEWSDRVAAVFRYKGIED